MGVRALSDRHSSLGVLSPPGLEPGGALLDASRVSSLPCLSHTPAVLTPPHHHGVLNTQVGAEVFVYFSVFPTAS